jgi:excisionase family DNA binding protein
MCNMSHPLHLVDEVDFDLTELLGPHVKPSALAKRASLSVAMIYKLVSLGRIQAVRFGKSLRIPRSEALRFLAEGTENK